MALGTELRNKLVAGLADWAVKGLWQLLLTSGFSLAVVLYALSRVASDLRVQWLIPVWVVLLTALLYVVLLGASWFHWRRAGRAVAALDKRYTTFSWRGVDWPILPAFHGLLHTTALSLKDRRASMGLLETAIGDPLCATCQSEVWASALEKKCAECGESFDIGRSNDVSLMDLKIEVYGKARARERQEANAVARRFMWRRRHD